MVRLLVAVLLIAGCGDSNPPPNPMTFSEINKQVFTISCALSDSCHKDANRSHGNLDLKTDPYTALINVPSFNWKANTDGLMRVVPGDSAHSFLYIKLTQPAGSVAGKPECIDEPQKLADGGVAQIVGDPANPDYGGCMPQKAPPMDPVTVAAIKRWIDSGAPNN